MKFVRGEVEMLEKIRGNIEECPHLLEIFDTWERDNKLVIITKLMAGGDLDEFCKENYPLKLGI